MRSNEPPATARARRVSSATFNASASGSCGDIPGIGGYGLGINVWTDDGGGSGFVIERGILNANFYTFDTVGSFSARVQYLATITVTATSATIYVNGS
jgi:hypothetical protein